MRVEFLVEMRVAMRVEMEVPTARGRVVRDMSLHLRGEGADAHPGGTVTVS